MLIIVNRRLRSRVWQEDNDPHVRMSSKVGSCGDLVENRKEVAMRSGSLMVISGCISTIVGCSGSKDVQ